MQPLTSPVRVLRRWNRLSPRGEAVGRREPGEGEPHILRASFGSPTSRIYPINSELPCKAHSPPALPERRRKAMLVQSPDSPKIRLCLRLNWFGPEASRHSPMSSRRFSPGPIHQQARRSMAWQHSTTSLCARCPMDRGDKPREDRYWSSRNSNSATTPNSGRFLLGHRLELATHQLARRRQRKLAREPYDVGHLVTGKALATVRDKHGGID